MSIEQNALDRYNSRYNNVTYKAVQKAIVRDLCGGYQAEQPALLERALGIEPVYTLLNLVIDVSQSIVGYPHPENTRDRLVRALADAQTVTPETVRIIGQHFENFEEDGSPFSADFEHTVIALLQLKALNPYAIRQSTSRIRGQAGNAANALVSATDALLQLARLALLNEPSRAYLWEKLQAGVRYIADAEEYLGLTPAKATDTVEVTVKISANQTLLISQDQTYPGLVTGFDRNGHAVVEWYKWGYDSNDKFPDWLTVAEVPSRMISAHECQQRFKTLPPKYQAEKA